jgi:hypothetical protein
MLHANSAWPARHARQIRDTGLARDNTTAARHGWQAREITPGTWSYRDPRFASLAVIRAAQPHVSSTGPTWAQAALRDRLTAAWPHIVPVTGTTPGHRGRRG